MHGLFRWSSKWWPGVIPLVIFWSYRGLDEHRDR